MAAAAQALSRKPTGTAAVAQRVIRQGGGKPAPSDTVNAKLTPGETVIPKELSEEALAPLVALYQRQDHLTQQDIEQFLYPILQNLEGGEEGMACGGRVGYAGGGGVVQTIKDMFTSENVLRNRREVQQMKDGTYQGQPEPAPTQPAETQPAPVATGQGNQPRGVEKAIKELTGRKQQIDNAVNEAQGFVLGGQASIADEPGKQYENDPYFGLSALIPGVAKPTSGMRLAKPQTPAAQPSDYSEPFINPRTGLSGTIDDYWNGQPTNPSPKPQAKSVADVAATATGTPNPSLANPAGTPSPGTPSPSLANPSGTNPAKVKTAEEPGAAINARSSQPDPVSAALLEPAKPPGTGMVTNRQGRTVTVVGNKEPLRQNGGGQGSYSEIPAGTSPFPMDKLGNPQANPQIRTNLPPGNTVERAKDYVDNMQGGTFLGKQEPASDAQKLQMYEALTGTQPQAAPQSVAQVAQNLQATPSKWEREIKANNDPLTGVGGVVRDLQSRLRNSHKRSTANALAEMLNVANAQDRTQMEGSLGQDRTNAELQGHELAADAAHERNLVDAEGNQISAVEKLANIAKGRGKERQEDLQANYLDRINAEKDPAKKKAILDEYQAVFGSNKAATNANWTDVEINDGVDELGNPKTKKIRMNRKTGETAPLEVPGQQAKPTLVVGQVHTDRNGNKMIYTGADPANPGNPANWKKP